MILLSDDAEQQLPEVELRELYEAQGVGWDETFNVPLYEDIEIDEPQPAKPGRLDDLTLPSPKRIASALAALVLAVTGATLAYNVVF
ncbi:TPA: hypothetical protein EYN47_01865, partial [Candidatus Saccharibacteria bacterium]|nr:hypothetical protein [Candidatus Saccharibacteria bacterium]